MTMNLTDPKQRCYDVIERFPAEHLMSIAAYLEAMHEEVMDEIFCATMSDRFAQSAERYLPGIPIEEVAAKWGIDLETDDEDED